MRSPAQHPSRHAGSATGLSLDLDLAAPPSGKAASSGRRPASSGRPAADTAKPSKRSSGKASGKAERSPAKATSAAARQGSALELDLPAPAGRTKTAAKPQQQAVRVTAPSGGLDEDGWDTDELDIGLELAADVAPTAAKRGSSPSVGMAPRESTRPRSLRPEEMDVPAGAIAQRADYGKAPASVLAAPLYAWRVFRRRRQLIEELAQQQGVHREADRAVRDKLRVLVEELAAKPEMDLDGLLGEVEELGRLLDGHKLAFAAANEQLAAQLASVDQQLDKMSRQRTQLEADRKLAKVHLDDCDDKQQRTARALSELQSKLEQAHEAARRAAGRGAKFAPPEHARRIAALQERRQQLDEQHESRRNATKAARGALRDKQHQLRSLDKQLDQQHQQRQHAEQQTDSERAGPLAAVEEARLLWLDAYDRALARIALERPKLIDADQEQRITHIHRVRTDNDRALAVMQRAVDAYDESAYKRGVTVIVVTAVLVSLLLLSALRVS